MIKTDMQVNRAIGKFRVAVGYYESIAAGLCPDVDIESDLAWLKLIGHGLFTGSLTLKG